MTKRYTDEQMVRSLREAESEQEAFRDVCKRYNIAARNLDADAPDAHQWQARSHSKRQLG